MSFNYDLNICKNNKEIINNFKDNKFYKIINWINNDNTYYIIKYNKDNLDENNLLDVGLYRSIIIKNNKLVAFSPPKSIPYENYKNKYELKNSIIE